MWPDGQTRHFVILLSHATRHFYIFRDFLSPNVQRRDSAAYRFASRHNTMTHDIRYYRLWTRLLCNIPLMERKIQRILVLRLMSFYSVCFHRCSIIIWWNLRAAVYLCIIMKKKMYLKFIEHVVPRLWWRRHRADLIPLFEILYLLVGTVQYLYFYQCLRIIA